MTNEKPLVKFWDKEEGKWDKLDALSYAINILNQHRRELLYKESKEAHSPNEEDGTK